MSINIKAHIDHVILGTGTLSKGMTEYAHRAGVKPIFGGVHKKLNTHNALLSLGNDQYLEILAPGDDSGVMNGPFGQWQLSDELSMIGWVVAINDLDLLVPLLDQHHIEHSGIQDLSRMTSEGKEIKWRNIFLLDDGVFSINPFFIEWGSDTIHPAAVTPTGCTLSSFRIADALINDKSALFDALNLDIQSTSDKSSLTLQTPNGLVSF